MAHPIIVADDCVACGICIDACPQGVLEIAGAAVTVSDEDDCIACGECVEACPMGVITEIAED